MQIGILSFTAGGSALSLKIAEFLTAAGYETRQYTLDKYRKSSLQMSLTGGVGKITEALFSTVGLIIYIGAAGIAVRAIAPYIQAKTSDPAVICMDELGKFTIPLLAGHIGGANALARMIAEHIGSVAVVTTATDVNNLPAIDEWAARNNVFITDMKMAKLVAAELVDGRSVGVYGGYPLSGELPKGFSLSTKLPVGIVVAKDTDYTPFAQTLFLIPRDIYLGIGCRRNTPHEYIEELVSEQLSLLNISWHRVGGIASVDLKQDEVGLLEFAAKHKLAAEFYTAEELLSVQGNFTASEFVKSVVGVDNVCERSAILRSNGGKMLLQKTAAQGVTLAICQKDFIIKF